ncbi:MAG: hypothetical protein R3B13_17520 [Polyangiaceae bacterium]
MSDEERPSTPPESEPPEPQPEASESPPESEPPASSDGDLDEDSDALRALLRGALDDDAPKEPSTDLLRGVQDKLRKRSGGKFYADGWSTARHPPTMTYLWTSLVMLAVVFVAYAILSSLVDEAKEVDNEPAPVQLVPPKRIAP